MKRNVVSTPWPYLVLVPLVGGRGRISGSWEPWNTKLVQIGVLEVALSPMSPNHALQTGVPQVESGRGCFLLGLMSGQYFKIWRLHETLASLKNAGLPFLSATSGLALSASFLPPPTLCCAGDHGPHHFLPLSSRTTSLISLTPFLPHGPCRHLSLWPLLQMASELGSNRNKKLESGAFQRSLLLDTPQFQLLEGWPLALHGLAPSTLSSFCQVRNGGPEMTVRTKGYLNGILNSATTAGWANIDAHQKKKSQKCHKLKKCQPKHLRDPETTWHVLWRVLHRAARREN